MYMSEKFTWLTLTFWRGHKMVQPSWRTHWHYQSKSQYIYSTYHNSTDWPTWMKSHMFKFIHSSIVHWGKTLETIQLFISRGIMEYFAIVVKHEETVYILTWKDIQDILSKQKHSPQKYIWRATFYVWKWKKKNIFHICLYLNKEILWKYTKIYRIQNCMEWSEWWGG